MTPAYWFTAGFCAATIVYGILACWLLDREANRIARQGPRITATPEVLREAKRKTLPYFPPGATASQRARLRAFQRSSKPGIEHGGES